MINEKRNPIFDIIIELLKGIKNDNKIKCDGNTLWGCQYLLGQVIRQYEIPVENYYISEKALNKWKEITDKSIMNYYYKDLVKIENSKELKLNVYKGASKEAIPTDVNIGDTFYYRDVFHDDHMIPVCMVIDKLIELENPTYENIEKILKGIYICKMLKKEDRDITEKSKRPYDVSQVITDIYDKHGVKIIKATDIYPLN